MKRRLMGAALLLLGLGGIYFGVEGWRSRPVLLPPGEPHTKTPTELLNPDKPLRELLPPGFDKAKVSALVEKKARRLTVYYNKEPLKGYEVVLGFSPGPDKLREGDGATPEGLFRVRDLYPHRRWSRFIWVSYPSEESYRKHETAKAEGRIPEQATIGGEIGIHGVPPGEDWRITKKSDWTLGCVSMRNADVEELYEAVTQGSEIEIRP